MMRTMMLTEEGEPHAWCPRCRCTRPCTLDVGTTDWQTTPVYTCRTCGWVIHEVALRALAPLARVCRSGAPAPVAPGTGAAATRTRAPQRHVAPR
jgi:hypothetical protein